MASSLQLCIETVRERPNLLSNWNPQADSVLFAEAVDMDVYGAFQLCSIAILVAPMTVKISETYNKTRGSNTIFLWAGLILSGEHCCPF